MNTKIDKKLKKSLLTRSHQLKPIIHIGKSGLSAQVSNEIEIGLNSHELIKIKILSDDRDIRKEMIVQICQQHQAQRIQAIGKISSIYRPREDD